MALTSTITIKNTLTEPLNYITSNIVEGGWANGAAPPKQIRAQNTTGPIILNPAVGAGSSATITYQIGDNKGVGSQFTITFTCSGYSDNIADWVPEISPVKGATLVVPVVHNKTGPLEATFEVKP